jgi:hypothetical protein
MSGDPNALLADLNAKVQSGDVEGGMATLSKIKVSLSTSRRHETDFCSI